jgi:hypothetical protein
VGTLWPWSGPPPSDDARVRSALLPRTLEHAATLPYYRKRWGQRWKHGLTALPVLRKADAVKHQRELLAPGTPHFVGVISSGTQHGDKAPLRVPEIDAEVDALDEFSRGRAHGGPAPEGGLELEVVSMQHGFPLGPAPEGVLRVGWTFSETTFKVIRELLLAKDRGRRVETLLIGARALPALTAWLYEQDFDFERQHVRAIGTTGSALTPHWKRRCEALWGARVWNNFSLSELAAPAPECEDCGHHHWLWPANLTEVLHPKTGAALWTGTGELVVTTLYPFVQAMPLVRYATGDLVELGPQCRTARERGFKMRGRVAQCVLSARGELVASPLDVEAFLDGVPEAERGLHPVTTLGVVRSVDVGVPRFDLEPAKGGASVRFEVRFDPGLFPQRADALCRALLQHLRGAASAARSAAISIAAVRKGTLTRRWTKF